MLFSQPCLDRLGVEESARVHRSRRSREHLFGNVDEALRQVLVQIPYRRTPRESVDEIRCILGPQIRPDRDERQIERQAEGLVVMGGQGGSRHRLAGVHATAVLDQDLDQRVELLAPVAAPQFGDDEGAERRERAGLAAEESTDICHGIAVDAQGNVYVSDRANHRMQVFDNNLGPKAIYDNVGDSWTVCISPGPHQYLFTSNSNPNGNAPGSWDISGEIYKMELDGTILGRFGHASKEFGGFQVVHMMDCRNPNEIIVAEIESWRVQKLLLKPQAPKVSAAK